GDQNVTGLLQPLCRICKFASCLRITHHAAGTLAVCEDIVYFQTIWIVKRTIVFTDTDDDCTEFGQDLRCAVPHIAKALYNYSLASDPRSQPQRFHIFSNVYTFPDCNGYPSTGRVFTSRYSVQGNRLARDAP